MKRKDITDEMVCRAYADKKALDMTAEALLMERTGAPLKVVYRAMERADDRGLIEWGVSLRTGWLTPKGIALLNGEELEPRP